MFKSFLCFIVAICFLLITSSYSNAKLSKYSKEVTLYANGYSSNASIIQRKALHSGESFSISKEEIDIEIFLQDYFAVVVFTEETEEGISYYAYTNKLTNEKIINGQKINLHIFMGKDKVTVGTPIIYGSF